MPVLAKNKKAYFDYHILEKIETGLVLSGAEVKSVRKSQVSFAGSFVSIKKGGCFLINFHISPYQPKNMTSEYNPKRDRKLLLKKKEIDYLYGKSKEGGITLIPLKIYTKNNLLKLEIGVARGKKKHDKREAIKRKSIDRDLKRRIKF